MRTTRQAIMMRQRTTDLASAVRQRTTDLASAVRLRTTGLAIAVLTCAALVPSPALPCVLVTGDGPLGQTGFRALYMPTADGRDTDMTFQVAFAGHAAGEVMGVVLPLSVRPESVTVTRGTEQGRLDDLARATQPTVVRPAASGCAGSCGPVVERTGAGTPADFGRFEIAMDRVADLEGEVISPGPQGRDRLEAWLQENDLVLGTRSGQRAVLEAVLDDGGHLVVFSGTGSRTSGGTLPVTLRLPGEVLEVPLAAGAVCAARPFDLEIYAVAGAQVVPMDEAHAGLQDLDRDLVRGTRDLDGVIRAMANLEERRFLLTEYALPVDRLNDRPTSDGLVQTLRDRGTHLTRIRSVLDPIETGADIRLEVDPGAPEVSPLLDVSFDPRAHGASLLPSNWLPVAALLLAIWIGCGRPRRRC